MKPFILIALVLFTCSTTFAAPKKSAKNDRPATAPLPKVPAQSDSPVQLTGNETPDQITKAYADAIKALLPTGGTNFTDAALLKLQATVHSAARPGAEPERVACCQAIATALATDLTRDTKAQLLRELIFIGNAEAVAIETKLLADKDPILREYARLALVHGGNAAPQVEAPAGLLSAEVRADFELITAYRLLREGKPSDANAIFQKLSAASQPRQARFEALRGTLTVAGDAAAPKMLALLAGNDADGRTVALGQIQLLSSAGRKTLIDGLDKVPPAIQGIVVESLANLGDKSVLPIALKYIQGTDASLRNVGLTMLTRLGDAACVPALVQAAATGDRAPYEQALVALPGGTATDAAIADALKAATGDTQRSLIAVLGKRGGRTAVPALLAVTGDADVQTAKAAYRALNDVVAAEDAPVLLQKVVAAKPDVRGDAENAAAKALLKMDQPAQRTAAVLAALGAPADADNRRSQLRLLRDCGDAKALATVKAALTDADAKTREAAVRALADWIDASAWESLLQICAQPEKETFRVLAFRGLVRLNRAENDRPNKKLLERYRQLLDGAKTDGDRKQILGALGGCASPAAADLALSMLAAPDLRAEVELAVKNIAESLKKKNPNDSRAVLQKLKQAK